MTRRAAIAAGILGATLFAGGAARADGETIVVLPPGQTAPPPPAAPQPTVVQPAPPPASPRGTVRVHFHAYKDASTRIYSESAPDRWVFVCSTPCDVDAPPGVRLRVVYDDVDEEPHDFTLDGNAGGRTDIEVRPASKGPLAGGIVMTSIGGLTALVGIVLVAVSSSSALTSSDRSGFQVAGTVCLLAGGGLTLGGILLITNRSHEPRIKQGHPSTEWGARDPGLAAALPKAVTLPLAITF